MLQGMRTGFLLYPNSADRILPITHINLVLDNDGKSIQNKFNHWNEVIANLETNMSDGRVLSVDTHDQLLALKIDKLKNGAICYVGDEDTYYSFTSTGGWKILTTRSTGEEDIYSHIWVGPDPPEDDTMFWYDTSSDGIVDEDDEKDLMIINNLLNKMVEMQNTIILLEKRVKYLEDHGVVSPDNPPVETENDMLLLEDGYTLLLEDGTELLLEVQSIPQPENIKTLLFEDGTELLLENGTNLLLE